MEGHCDGRTLGTHESDVAALLAKDGALSGRDDVDVYDLVLLRQSPAFLVLGFKAELDGLADVGEGLFVVPTLTDASRNQRAFGHEPAVFARSQHHRKLHV